jgi:hypothetical protein
LCRSAAQVNATSALWERSLAIAAAGSAGAAAAEAAGAGSGADAATAAAQRRRRRSADALTEGTLVGVGAAAAGVSSAELLGTEALRRMAQHPMELPLYLFLATQVLSNDTLIVRSIFNVSFCNPCVGFFSLSLFL